MSKLPTFNSLALLGVPFDDNSSFERGPAKAPAVIKNVLAHGSLNKGTELGVNLADNPQWQIADDVSFSAYKSMPYGFNHDIEQAALAQLSAGNLCLSLGGDHSVSYPLLKAYAQHFPELTILHIDAHSDLYDSFKGNPYSNACPFARVMEDGLCQRLVQVGIRTLNAHQIAQAEKFSVEMFEMRHWPLAKPLSFETPVYLSLDIDGIDPAFAPGVSHREPGGLTTREVINLIHQIDAPLVGADIVEFNPNRDIDGVTAQVAAKLTKELAGKIIQSSLNG
ncbi:agmatinase [Thalassotalea euphylliae]|uniref:Agmatinase n=1 Tax=Thalassotalea euphylliae TaxID=1655234 RepID=A0A3E0UIU6_9GAMM|nr:agmatinase [Thalassotalea euphylliae]REL36928.1 agmatinase [Thalassotalea euphylliae]